VGFFFAWVDAGDDFGPQHLREDEVVLSFDIAHLEGQIPTLSVEIRNPRIGLLAPGRKQWMWFSWQSSPLFHGRLVALPSNLFDEVITLQFLARPVDYLAQKQAVADALKVSPYYDPVWIDQTKLNDPDSILEPYTASWHVDRTSLEITTSDMLLGEDGVEEFLPEDSFYDSVSISFAQSPQTRVVFNGSVSWTQAANGIIKLPDIHTTAYNGDAWLSDWPKQGSSLQGGWSVAESAIYDLYGTSNAHTFNVSASYQNNEQEHEDMDTMSANINLTVGMPGTRIAFGTLVFESFSGVQGDYRTGTPASGSHEQRWVSIYHYVLWGKLSLRYDMSRKRGETITFTMDSNLQSIVTAPADEPANPIVLSMNGTDVGLNLQGIVPIGDPARSSFFPTDRGIKRCNIRCSWHGRICCSARRHVVDCTFGRAVNLSCRRTHCCMIFVCLAGGPCKDPEYHIKGSGDTGLLVGSVQIESTVGAGGTVTVSEGTPEYVDDGYVVPGYQFYADTSVALPTEDITFTVPRTGTVDDGLVLPLTMGQAVSYQVNYGFGVTPNPNPATDPTSNVPAITGEASATLGVSEQAITAMDQQNIVEQTMQDQVRIIPTWLQLELEACQASSQLPMTSVLEARWSRR
jgi:hypothetical protein